jgi:hypothetical protein
MSLLLHERRLEKGYRCDAQGQEPIFVLKMEQYSDIKCINMYKMVPVPCGARDYFRVILTYLPHNPFPASGHLPNYLPLFPSVYKALYIYT